MFDKTMSMAFQTLNLPSYRLGFVDMQRKSSKIRLNPVRGMPPSSVYLQTDENGNLAESKKDFGLNLDSSNISSADSLLSQANTVGIIGGISVNSTLKFLKNLVKWGVKDDGDSDSALPFIVCSDPGLTNELILHEKNSFPNLHSKSKCNPLDPLPVVENLKSKRFFLEKSGARCIVMPCNISHSWYNEVSLGCSVPFLHMGECVAKELKELNLKPLEAGSPLRIGVLATNATLSAGFYQEKLENEGFEVIVPDKATMEHTVIPAVEALNRKDMEGARNLVRITLQVLLVKGVNRVIVASDDMWDLLPRDDLLLKRCIDPVDSLARSTIKWAQTIEEGM